MNEQHTPARAYLAAMSHGICARQPFSEEQLQLITPYKQTETVDFYQCTGKILLLPFYRAGIREFRIGRDMLQILARLKGSDTYWSFEAGYIPLICGRMRGHEQRMNELTEIITMPEPDTSFDQYLPAISRLVKSGGLRVNRLMERQVHGLGMELEAYCRNKGDHTQTLEKFLGRQSITGEDFLNLLAPTPLWQELTPYDAQRIQTVHGVNAAGTMENLWFPDGCPGANTDMLLIGLAANLAMFHE
jgi:hypothetical protein